MAAIGNLAPSADPKDLADEDASDPEDTTVTSRELFWDKIILFLATTIVALTAVDVLAEILGGDSGAVCFIPEEFNATESQDAFVQNFCSQRIRKIGYLPIFVLVHGLLIGAGHYVWKSSFSNNFNYFFTLSKSLSRFKDKDTGEFPYENVAIIKKLQLEFSVYNRQKVFLWYLVKLVFQGLVAVASIVFSLSFFAVNFDASFDCPQEGEAETAWPYPGMSVTCISSSVQLFWLIRWVDIVLLFALIGLLIWGLLYMTVWPHPKYLNIKQAALFAFTTGIDCTFYVPKSNLHYLRAMLANSFRWLSEKIVACFQRRESDYDPDYVPRISTDLDFFVFLLYRTDSSLGHAFFEGQVYLEHKALMELDQFLISNRSTFEGALPLKMKHLESLQWRDQHSVQRRFSLQTSTASKWEEFCRLLDIPHDSQELGRLRGNERKWRAVMTQWLAGGGGGGRQGAYPVSWEGLYRLLEAAGCEEQLRQLRNAVSVRDYEIIIDKKSKRQIDSINTGWRVTMFPYRDDFWSQSNPPDEPNAESASLVPIPANLRGALMGLALRAPGNDTAVCVSFGSLGLSNVLIRVFHQVGSLNFDPAYQNEERPVTFHEDTAGIFRYHTYDDIFTRPTNVYSSFTAMTNRLWENRNEEEPDPYKIQFMVIGPITELRHLATARVLLEDWQGTVRRSKFAKNAVLVIVEVDKIEGTSGKGQFYHLQPPKGLFRPYDPSLVLQDSPSPLLWPILGEEDTKPSVPANNHPANLSHIQLKCGDTVCKFKIHCYLFGKRTNPPAPAKLSPPESQDAPSILTRAAEKHKSQSPSDDKEEGRGSKGEKLEAEPGLEVLDPVVVYPLSAGISGGQGSSAAATVATATEHTAVDLQGEESDNPRAVLLEN